MHFLFVYPSPGIWGGIETQIVRMSHWLIANGHAVSVVTVSDREWGALLPPSVRCVALGEEYWKLIYYHRAARIWRRLAIPRPDVVKSFNWEFRTAWIGYQLAAISGAKCVAGYYAPRQMLKREQREFYLNSYLRNIPDSAKIFMSPEQIEELEEAHGHTGRLWPLPVDSDRFTPAPRHPEWGRLVSIGRLGDMKGYNFYMIDVVRELRDRGLDVTWTVYGTGEYEGDMRSKIREQGLVDHVTMAGSMPYTECHKALSDAYIYVGMGTTIIEASLFKVPNVLALAFDRSGVTYGPLHRMPLGSVGDTRNEPPHLTVADELDRILRLSQDEYASECERACEYAQPYRTDASMRLFLTLVNAATAVRPSARTMAVNYLHGPQRRLRRTLPAVLNRLLMPRSQVAMDVYPDHSNTGSTRGPT